MDVLKVLYKVCVFYVSMHISFNTAGDNELFGVQVHHPGKICGDEMCTCQGNYALCLNRGRRLTFVPDFKLDITNLNYTGNYLPKITDNTFNNLTDLKLVRLGLKSNSIMSCEPRSFSSLLHLRTLIICHEGLNTFSLMNCLSSVTKQLTGIILINLPLVDLYSLHFSKCMAKSNLNFFKIQEMNIIVYNHSIVSSFKKLQSVTIVRCKVTTVKLQYSASIENFRLIDNRLTQFPDICVNGSAMFPKLTDLNLDNNYINNLRPGQLSCMKALIKFSINENPLIIIESNIISSLPNIQYMSIGFIYSTGQLRVKPHAFSSHSLRHLSFRNNKIRFDNKSLSLGAFNHCTNLRTLIISSNYFTNTTEEMFEELFKSLTKIKKLSLTNNRLRFIPKIIPKQMKKLNVIYLAYNEITQIPDGFFDNLKSLKNLDMSGNHISRISKITFSEQILKNMQWLDLSNNPYSCSCDLLWFIRFLRVKNNSRIFRHFPSRYKCNAPDKEQHKYEITKSFISERICTLSSQISLGIIYVSVTFLLLLLTISIVYRYRWCLRYLIYMARFHQIRFRRLLNEGINYQYDVYLSCSDGDFDDFIFDEIVNKLEKDMGLRLYIPQRDGQGNKIEQIIINMDRSRKALLCISDRYAEDGFCEFEAGLAYEKYIIEKRDLMIVVVLKELAPRNVTKTIHKILAVNNYIKWDEENLELFWEKINTTINRVDDLVP
ncbi:toll-like receptor 4 [Patella vulgata]|uniref:toll-like receptor 4 n=1 Tax=Patella vulgata TaxID=6465 RepID=UPI00218014BE|nr:toll-like receptor 4 [Patella vulgata]XP_050406956.1 toll-like receptor 4 [Patella vulgata]